MPIQAPFLFKLYPPADLLHRSCIKIADFKYQVLQLQKPNKQREYQQICADQRLSTKLQISLLLLWYLPILEQQNFYHRKLAMIYYQDLH